MRRRWPILLALCGAAWADNGHYRWDFGNKDTPTSITGWNNINSSENSCATSDTTSHFAVVDSAGSSTSVTLHFSTAFTAAGPNTVGTQTSSIYPAEATGDSCYISKTGFGEAGTTVVFDVENLNVTHTYTLTFYASRMGTGTNRTTDYTIGSTTVSLDATDNVDTVVRITGAAPSVGGAITVTVTINAASADFGYLGVLEVESDNVLPTANAGADQSVSRPGTVTLSGSGEDTDGTISSYAWSETTSKYAAFSSPTAATTTVTDLVPGPYTFRLTVTDNSGGQGTDDVSVTVGTSTKVSGCSGKTIVVLGSSTAVGTGASPSSAAWANLFGTYAAGHTVTNLAVGGYTTYHILPTGTDNGGRPAVDEAKNITAALALSPDAVIVNMPTNDAANGYTVNETEANFALVSATARAAGVPIWIATPQPRNLDAAGRVLLTTVRDWVNSTYLGRSLDFWSVIANTDGTVASAYDSGDGAHLNNRGHHHLFSRVINGVVLDSLCAQPAVLGVTLP